MAVYFCWDNVTLKTDLGGGPIFLLFLLTSYGNIAEQGSKPPRKYQLDCCSARVRVAEYFSYIYCKFK